MAGARAKAWGHEGMRAWGHEGMRAKGQKGKRAKTTNYNFPLQSPLGPQQAHHCGHGAKGGEEEAEDSYLNWNWIFGWESVLGGKWWINSFLQSHKRMFGWENLRCFYNVFGVFRKNIDIFSECHFGCEIFCLYFNHFHSVIISHLYRYSWEHTWYLSYFLHGQKFWRIKFTPKNANFSR